MANEASAPAELAAPKKNKSKVIIIATIAILLAVGLSAAGAWFFLNKESEAQPEQSAQAIPQGKQKAVYELLEPAFVVNFHSQGRQRYMQASLALMSRNENELKQLKVDMPTLRNQLVMLFSSQDFEELNSPVGIELLKQKATAAVQELAMREVGNPVVEQVLFTNFVMQ